MSPSSGGKNGLGPTSDDAISPSGWAVRLSPIDFASWLRQAIATREPYPFVTPPGSELTTFFGAALRGLPEPQAAWSRNLIVEMLREWRNDCSGALLDDLLVLAANVRPGTAASEIVNIVAKDLAGHADEVVLRQRGLRVLAGFGCTDGNAWLFERYIEQPDYAAICYRALYRYQPLRAAADLPRLMTALDASDREDDLSLVLDLMCATLTEREVVAVVVGIMQSSELGARPMKSALEQLTEAGVILAKDFGWYSSTARDRIEVRYGEKSKACLPRSQIRADCWSAVEEVTTDVALKLAPDQLDALILGTGPDNAN